MNFHNIEPNNIENGKGIRTVLWVSGCFHNCPGCHNPITHNPDDGVLFTDDSMRELLNSLNHKYIDGVTFSGGDPLTYYPEDTLEIMREIRRRFDNKKTIWVYTGFTLDWLLKESMNNPDPIVRDVYTNILLHTDVLCDGKFVQELALKEYHWVGSTNQRVIDLKESFKQAKVVFLEEEQEKLCSTDSTETNILLKEFCDKVIKDFVTEIKETINLK